MREKSISLTRIDLSPEIGLWAGLGDC